MSFDLVFGYFFGLLDIFEKKEKKKIPKIGKDLSFQNKSSTLKVIIPHWEGWKSGAIKILAKRLNKKGHSVAVYHIHKNILLPDAELSLGNFERVKNQIAREIREMKKEYAFDKVELVGISLGNVVAFQVANGNKDIDGIFSIVPGNCLASCLWDGIRTSDLRKKYEKQGISKRKLQNIWRSIAPKNNIEKIVGKELFLALSHSDKVIPYEYGQLLAKALKRKTGRIVIQENKSLGHYLTVIKYCLFSDELLK